MPLSLRTIKIITAYAAFALLTVGCGHNRVVVGRGAENVPVAAPVEQSQPEAPANTAENTAQKPEQKPAPKKPVSVLEGMKGGTMGMGSVKKNPDASGSKTETAATAPDAKDSKTTADAETVAAAEPQSSPARPRPEPPPEEPQAAPGPAPYKLDLSFGGFGLGIGLFDTPMSIAVDDQENMYVVDQGNYRVQKFDRFGLFQFAFGRQGMGDGEFTQQTIKPPSSKQPNPDNCPSSTFQGQALRETGEFEFNKPVGIFLDRDNTKNPLIRIHVVDSLNNRIQRFLIAPSSEQDFETFFDCTPSTPSTTSTTNIFIMLTNTGIMADDSATVGVSSLHDLYKNVNTRQAILDPLYLLKANFPAPFVWGGLGFTQGQLNTPTYLAMDENNVLWVSDTGNGRVEGFNVSESNPANDATYFREFGDDINLPYGAGRLNQPTSIAYDNQGFGGFLVLDKLQNGGYAIEKFDRDGRFTGVFLTSGDKDGQLKQPVAIAVNTFDNTCYVTDRGLRKVMVYNSKGDFMYQFGGDELADPRGITVLRNGYVYVTDAAKNMVYRYVPQ